MKRKINIFHRYPLTFICLGTTLSLSVMYSKLVYDMFRSYSKEEIAAYELKKQELKERVKHMKLRSQ